MKPNTAPIRYDRWQLEQLMKRAGLSGPRRTQVLDQYEHVRVAGKDKPCQAVVHHGPGHQSTTYCQVVGGDAAHDHLDENGNVDPTASPTHYANLPSGGIAEWTDERPYSDSGWS